jgi:hypothetical protein
VSKSPEFYADFRSEGFIQKKCTEKKIIPKNCFSTKNSPQSQKKVLLGLTFFNSFFNNFFISKISIKFVIFDTQIDLFREKNCSLLEGAFLTRKYEICIAKAEKTNI